MSQERVHAEETSTRWYISVCDMILPRYNQNFMKASQVEYVEPFLLLQVGSPGLAPIQENADHTSIIDNHLGVSGQP